MPCHSKEERTLVLLSPCPALILGLHQIATGTQHMRASSRPEGAYYSVPPDGVKAFPELLRTAGYFTYTDNKLDYQFSGPLANSGPPSIWDLEGAAAADWSRRAPDQPFFGFINFMATHESGLFPPLLVHMIAVGEKSGELEQMLARAADAYDGEVEASVSALSSIMEPVLVIFMGAVVLFIVMAILLPIFELNELVK